MKCTFLFLYLLIGSIKLNAQSTYFPPLSSAATWDTISPGSLGWCVDKIDTLYDFLEQENTKGFMVLKDGKIILEKYFGTFTQDSIWYWASAGKTITSFLLGKAVEEGYCSLSDPSSNYLGAGWTSSTSAQENQITLLNQLTMTSGLDDGVIDNHCTIDTCLTYLAPVNTRWAYHNAVYTLLGPVIENASGITINNYMQQKLKTTTGMTGTWLNNGFDNVYYSRLRSMARFGLLIQNNCIWNNDTLLKNQVYKNQMLNTSQSLNKSYGYLWWLNGKSSFMLPTTQITFPGSLAPNAPMDMYAGLGKNGQILSISPSKGLVVVRMGNSPNTPSAEVTTVFCDQIWQKLNAVMCTNPSSEPFIPNEKIASKIQINYSSKFIRIINESKQPFTADLLDIAGKHIIHQSSSTEINIANLYPGLYILLVTQNGMQQSLKLIIKD